MISAARLSRARASVETLHTDTFAVYRPTGATTTDPETLVETPVYDTVHASVKGKFQATASQNLAVATPGQQVAETRFEWHTSINTLGILTDDEVECVAVDPLMGDPDLVGTRVRITGPFLKTHATARRFQVSELT